MNKVHFKLNNAFWPTESEQIIQKQGIITQYKKYPEYISSFSPLILAI